MKRYALFTYWQYYPGGGWNDFKDSFDTVKEAAAVGRADVDENGPLHFFDVIDLTNGKKVSSDEAMIDAAIKEAEGE